MTLEIETPMSVAIRDGMHGYQPTFRGQPLEVEGSDPGVSQRNLRILLDAGLRVATMIVVEHSNILIVFMTGEMYLATGFSVGESSELTSAFALFASKVYANCCKLTVSQWNAHLGAYAPGDVIAPEMNESASVAATTKPSKPKVFRGN